MRLVLLRSLLLMHNMYSFSTEVGSIQQLEFLQTTGRMKANYSFFELMTRLIYSGSCPKPYQQEFVGEAPKAELGSTKSGHPCRFA